jgi:hypothetical protein
MDRTELGAIFNEEVRVRDLNEGSVELQKSDE